jgi:chromosome partitioning protein
MAQSQSSDYQQRGSFQFDIARTFDWLKRVLVDPVPAQVIENESPRQSKKIKADGPNGVLENRIVNPVHRQFLENEDQPLSNNQVVQLSSIIGSTGDRANERARGLSTQMRIIAVASQKGGSGKTTIAGHLAVQAGLAGHGPALLIDTDPQGSLAEWWRVRKDDSPALARVKLENLENNLDELRSYGTAITIIDTPPALTGSIEQVIAIADLVVIPARPSPHDLRAVGGTVAMCRRAGKPFVFVLNGATQRANITVQAAAALSEHGRVSPVILYQRTEYAASMIDGRTVGEAAPSGNSAQEIAELWKFVYTQISVREAA